MVMEEEQRAEGPFGADFLLFLLLSPISSKGTLEQRLVRERERKKRKELGASLSTSFTPRAL